MIKRALLVATLAIAAVAHAAPVITQIGLPQVRAAQLGSRAIGTLCEPDDAFDCTLWVTDGTTAGTRAVIPPIGKVLPRRWFTSAGNYVYFVGLQRLGDGPVNEDRVWRTDGTGFATAPVLVGPQPSQNKPAAVGSVLLYPTSDGIWRTDGTAPGTYKLIDAPDQNLVVSAGAVYFARNDPGFGSRAWKTDGTVAGTVLLADNGATSPGQFYEANGRVYFLANDAGAIRQLYSSDGTAAGTQALFPASGNLEIQGTTGFTMVFEQSATGRKLWRTDGTPAGTVFLADMAFSMPVDSTSHAGAGSFVYFNAVDGSGKNLWRTDGTLAGTVRADTTIVASYANSFTVIGSVLYGTNGSGCLWRTAGLLSTDNVCVTNTDSPYPWAPPVGNQLLFSGPGQQLWITDDTTAGSHVVNVTIADNEAGFAFTQAAFEVSEGAGTVHVEVRRTGATTAAGSVKWTATNGSATLGKDYGVRNASTPPTGTLSWTAGDAAPKSFTIPIMQDMLSEGSETFLVTLSAPVGGGVGASPITTVTIVDDDIPPESRISFTPAKVVAIEGGAGAVLTLHREAINGPFTAPASVSYATVAGTAFAPADYLAKNGAVTWDTGDTADKTIQIAIITDAIVENPKSFKVTLTASASHVEIATPQATVTILDDDEVFPRSGALPEGWTVPASATSGWHVSNDAAPYEGVYSLRADQIEDDESAQIEVTRTFLAGNITFRVKVSSEVNFDKLRFFVDDQQKGSWSGGGTAWVMATIPVTAGPHTIRWSYEKDSSGSVGYDSAWIDAVTLP